MSALIVLFERTPAPAEAEEALGGAGVSVVRGDGGTLRASIGGSEAELAIVAAPLARATLVEAALHSAWPEAAGVIERQVAHARLVPSGDAQGAPLERLLAVSRMAAQPLASPE